MVYVQFYRRNADDSLAKAYGDRSVAILDDRCSRQWLDATAADLCRRRGYAAWRLFKGEAFTRSAPFGALFNVDKFIPPH